MARKIGQNWEPCIPIRVVDIYVSGVERMRQQQEPDGRTLLIVEGRTRFLRELIDELLQKQEAQP